MRIVELLFIGAIVAGSFPAGESQAATGLQGALTCVVQSGGCDVILTKNRSGDVVLKEGLQVSGRFAGKTLCIPAGAYRSLYVEDLQGRADARVTITNCDGQAVFTTTGGSTISFVNSRYVHFTGAGDPATTYGFVAHNSGPATGFMVDVGKGSSDMELDHIEAKGNPLSYSEQGAPILTGGTGIAFKSYPRCSDRMWERGTFTQYHTHIHHNYVHDTGLEGLYVGTSHNGWVTANNYTPGRNCSGVRLIEADLINVIIEDNVLENIGNDAIQVGGSLESTSIARNAVRGYGLNSDPAHSAGIQLSPGTKATVNANWLENPLNATWVSQGVKHQGLGDTYITNNVIIGASNGFQLLRNTDVNLGISLPETYIYNNTVVSSRAEAIYMLCSYLRTVIVRNNLVSGYVSAYLSGNGGLTCVPQLTARNLFLATPGQAGFVDASQHDYHLTAGSPAQAPGVDLSGVVEDDFDGEPRNQVYNYGAYR